MDDQLYGVVQVEPGSDVVTLEVKDEKIRFAVQNVQCADRGCSKDGLCSMSPVRNQDYT